MANYNALEALINAYIKQNGVKAITGQVLNGVLRGMVSALGKGWTIAEGDARPDTDPGTMTGPVAYVAHTAGTYIHFGGLVVNEGEVALLKYNEQTWTKEVLASLAATASVDGNVGTPSVGVSWVNGVLTFDFHNLKGVQGDTGNTGAAAGFGTPTATVDANVGTPGVTVTASGPDTAKVFSFQFTNLKGEQGDQGIQGPEGPEGPTGPTGVTSVVVTVDNTSGNPACTASLSSGVLTLAFTGLKGAQGDTGSSVDYPFTIANNLTTNDATQALSAAMGVQLEGEVSQLEAKVDDVVIGMGNLVVSLFKKAAYLSDDAEADITALENLLSGSIARIEAVYTQSGVIYEGESLDDLKSGLVVTAYYLDGTSDIVTGYTLSGTLVAGTSAVTVSFGGVTTTFNVTVTDAVWYVTSEKFAKNVAVRSNITSSTLNIGATINGVQYNFTGGSGGNSQQRCVYYLFDLLWEAGETYKIELYFSGKTASQTIFMGLQAYDETFRQAGVANVKQVCDYISDMVDSGWLTPTENNGVLETTYVAPSSPVVTVGTRMAFKVQVSGTDQVWPGSLTIERMAIRKIS